MLLVAYINSLSVEEDLFALPPWNGQSGLSTCRTTKRVMSGDGKLLQEIKANFCLNGLTAIFFSFQLCVGKIGICTCRTTVKEMFEDGKRIQAFKDTGSSLLEMMDLFFYPLRNGHTGTYTCKTLPLAISKAAMETLVRRATLCSLATSSSATNNTNRAQE